MCLRTVPGYALLVECDKTGVQEKQAAAGAKPRQRQMRLHPVDNLAPTKVFNQFAATQVDYPGLMSALAHSFDHT